MSLPQYKYNLLQPSKNCRVFVCIVLFLLIVNTNTTTTAAMRIVIQRVKSASVTVDNKQVSAIGQGTLALVGLHHEDKESDLQYCAKRLLAIKLWENENGAPWRQHVKQKAGFRNTLCQSIHAIRYLPDYKLAMKNVQAKEMYNKFLDMLRDGYDQAKIFDGKFGEMMDVGLVNDGPVTLVIDSREGMIGSQLG